MRIVLLSLLVFIISCGKEKGHEPVVKSPTQLLTQKQWVWTSFGYDANGNKAIDASEESIEACEKDNTYAFNANGSGNYADNTLVCATGMPNGTFSWKWDTEGKTMEIELQPMNVLKLDEHELVLELAAFGGAGMGLLAVYRR